MHVILEVVVDNVPLNDNTICNLLWDVLKLIMNVHEYVNACRAQNLTRKNWEFVMNLTIIVKIAVSIKPAITTLIDKTKELHDLRKFSQKYSNDLFMQDCRD